jgi:ABC-type phosphate/phosphonate transport system substrate-binding protein
MIATLPMYDWPEIREDTEAWWSGIARHLASAVPLSHPAEYMASWDRPDLLFSQTCGYPFTHALKGRVDYVATPRYAADGCAGTDYCSIVFARESKPPGDFRGSTAAVNTPDSMSGMLALKLVFAPYAEQGVFFGKAILSGGHRRSLAAVREGRADVCAIDAVCVELARRYAPQDLEGLVEIARSPPVPALPYVTVGGDVGELRRRP